MAGSSHRHTDGDRRRIRSRGAAATTRDSVNRGASVATSARVCDVAGNCTTGTYPVGIDSHGPTVTITGVTDDTAYTRGAVPAASCVATDATTGLDGTCTITVQGGNTNQVGAYVATATAQDRAGNVTPVMVRYKVF